MKKGRKLNRTPIYICAILTGVEMGALFSWSYFRDSLAKLFPEWSASSLSLVFSTHNVTVVVVALLTGVLLRRLKPRTVLMASAVTLLIGFGLFPFLPTDDPQTAYVMLLLIFGVVAASSAGMSGIAATAAYQPWAPDRLGLLTGLIFLVAGCSPMLLGFVCSLLIPVFGVLRAVRILGIICFLCILVTMPWCRLPDASTELPPAPPKTKENAATRDYAWNEVLVSPLFWSFFLYNAAARSAGIILSDLGGAVTVAFGVSALFGLLFASANGVVSVIGGAISDRIGVTKTMSISCVLLILCGGMLLLGNAADNVAVIVAALIVGGAGYGISLMMGASATRILFGDKYYAQNYSFITISIALAAASGYGAGNILDRMNGAYVGVFAFVLVLGVLVAVFTRMTVLMQKKDAARGVSRPD
jgi:MFS family permease